MKSGILKLHRLLVIVPCSTRFRFVAKHNRASESHTEDLIWVLLRAEMTKRPFPFESSICRQSKTHLNNYENDITALNGVRERTLRKLFDGPRKLHSSALDKGGSLCSVENDRQSENNNFMQKLLTNYITVNGRKMKDDDRMVMRAAESPSSCFFCEARTDPTQQCIQCLEFYCSNCSFVNYESTEDRSICLSCS